MQRFSWPAIVGLFLFIGTTCTVVAQDLAEAVHWYELAAGIRELEPHAVGLKALWSPGTGIIDFLAVSRAFAHDVVERRFRNTVRTDQAHRKQGAGDERRRVSQRRQGSLPRANTQ